MFTGPRGGPAAIKSFSVTDAIAAGRSSPISVRWGPGGPAYRRNERLFEPGATLGLAVDRNNWLSESRGRRATAAALSGCWVKWVGSGHRG